MNWFLETGANSIPIQYHFSSCYALKTPGCAVTAVTPLLHGQLWTVKISARFGGVHARSRYRPISREEVEGCYRHGDAELSPVHVSTGK
jgi:hypothetical protein